MLDNRILTFLKLCEKMNYTKTAEELHITQPAVTLQTVLLFGEDAEADRKGRTSTSSGIGNGFQ